MKREFRDKAQGLADLIHYAAFIAEGICLLKDGSLLAGFVYRGQDLGSSEPKSLTFLSAQVNQALCQLGDGWMLHVDMQRFSSCDYPHSSESFFPDATSRLIDEERRTHYLQEDAHFESRYFMLFTYQTPTATESRLNHWLIKEDNALTQNDDRVVRYFLDGIDKIENALSHHLHLTRLNSQALLTHLHTCITGLGHTLTLPRIPVYLDTLLASQDFIGGLQPKIGEQFIKVISIVGLPLESQPGLLDLFEQLPLAFRWSNRFIFLDPISANKELAIYTRSVSFLGVSKSALI